MASMKDSTAFICNTRVLSAQDQQQTFCIMLTTAATARNIQLIVEAIVTSHTSIKPLHG